MALLSLQMAICWRQRRKRLAGWQECELIYEDLPPTEIVPLDLETTSTDPVAVQAAALQIGQQRPVICKGGQRAGEPQHVTELLGVPLLSPQPVVKVLGPASDIGAGGLDVAYRGPAEIQTFSPGLDPEHPDAVHSVSARGELARARDGSR